MKNKFLKLISVLLIAALSTTFFTACSKTDIKDEADAGSFILLSINPAVEIITDSNDVVTGVNCVNEDAEILLSETELTGMTIEEASNTFVTLAAEAGYIDVENVNEVNISVANDDLSVAEKIYNRISEKAQTYFDNNSINGFAVRENFEEIQTQADIYKISVYKMRLILAVIENNPEFTIETLVDLTTDELNAILKANFEELKDIATQLREDYNTLKAAIKADYVAMFALGDEIEALEKELDEFTGTDEGRLALSDTIAAKQAEFDTLFTAYKAEMEATHDTYKEQSKIIREQLKSTLISKRQNMKDKIKEHADNFKEEIEDIKAQAKEYRISIVNMKLINVLTTLYPADYIIDNLKDSTTDELVGIIKTKYDALVLTAETLKETYETEKEAINSNAKYVTMFILKEELDILNDELNVLEHQQRRLEYQLVRLEIAGTQEEITAIETEIAAKQTEITAKEAEITIKEAEYDPLFNDYKTEIEAARNAYEAQAESVKIMINKLFNAYKDELNNSYKQELRDAYDSYKEQKENIKDAAEELNNMFGHGKK